jgi:hypothetical protein
LLVKKTGYGIEMIQSNLLSLKSGTGLLGISGNLQKGNIEEKQSLFGLIEGPLTFLNLLKGNMSFIGRHNGKAFGESIAALQKGLCSKEGCKDGKEGIHQSDSEVIAHFLKGCGFNEKEIEKIVCAIKDDSGSLNVKNKGPFDNGKAFGEGVVALQKGLCSKEGCKNGGAGIHRPDREMIAHFLKGCGFNEKEIEKIVCAIRDGSGSLNVKNTGPTVIGEKGIIGTESPRLGLLNGLSLEKKTAGEKLSDTDINKKGATSSIFAKSRCDKRNSQYTPEAVGHNENKAELEKSLIETGTKELSNRKTEVLHKGIRPLDSLINESFSGEKHQNNISHVNNVSANVNEGDIKPRILIKQIVEGAEKKLSNGLGRVKIALNPPHLGKLHMDIVLNNNKVQVILQVENDKVRNVLQLNVEQLKNSLHSQGLTVDNVNVFLQEKSDNTNYEFRPNGHLFKEGKNRGENGEDQDGEQDFLSHNSSILEEKESGLQTDGRISLFA